MNCRTLRDTEEFPRLFSAPAASSPCLTPASVCLNVQHHRRRLDHGLQRGLRPYPAAAVAVWARKWVAILLATASWGTCAQADLNSASQAELERVGGVGPALSNRILQARDAAPFGSWVDLRQRVPGLGSLVAARLSREGWTLGGMAYPATDADLVTRESKQRAGASRSGKTKPRQDTKRRPIISTVGTGMQNAGTSINDACVACVIAQVRS